MHGIGVDLENLSNFATNEGSDLRWPLGARQRQELGTHARLRSAGVGHEGGQTRVLFDSCVGAAELRPVDRRVSE